MTWHWCFTHVLYHARAVYHARMLCDGVYRTGRRQANVSSKHLKFATTKAHDASIEELPVTFLNAGQASNKPGQVQ